MPFKYYNRNPDNLRLKDCVCRAISTATGLYYEAVDNLLDMISKEYGCDKLCVCCYKHLLEDTLCYVTDYCNYSKTVKDLVSEFPKNVLVIRISEHLTSAINGTVLDIWDCSEELVDCYWIIR